MDLQVVIVNWNSGELLGRLLSCLDALRSEVRQILVADNASDDGSIASAESRPGIHLLTLDSNLGFAAAANRAIAQSDSAWILLLNPDITIAPGTVRELYQRAEAMPEVALACVALEDVSGRSQAAFQFRSLPTVTSVLSDVLFLDELTGVVGDSKAGPGELSFSETRPGHPVVVQQPAAAFWLIRRSTWIELGGFDEQFWPAWFEDVDFCRRLSGTPRHAVVFPDLKASHVGGHSLEALSYRQFLDYYYGNMLRYLKKHHRGTYPFLWPAVKLGILLRKLIR